MLFSINNVKNITTLLKIIKKYHTYHTHTLSIKYNQKLEITINILRKYIMGNL